MNDTNDLLDRSAFEPLSKEDTQIVRDGQRAGGATSSGEISAGELAHAITKSTDASETSAPNSKTGVVNQDIEPEDLSAAIDSSAAGGDSDISGGEPNTPDLPNNNQVEQYNR